MTLSRFQLEYQKKLRFIREGKEQLTLQKTKKDDPLSKPVVDLGGSSYDSEKRPEPERVEKDENVTLEEGWWDEQHEGDYPPESKSLTGFLEKVMSHLHRDEPGFGDELKPLRLLLSKRDWKSAASWMKQSLPERFGTWDEVELAGALNKWKLNLDKEWQEKNEMHFEENVSLEEEFHSGYAKIAKGPHLLFKGANGKHTFGITVRAVGHPEQVEDRGHKREWDINDFTVMNTDKKHLGELLGLSPDEVDNLRAEIIRLVHTQGTIDPAKFGKLGIDEDISSFDVNSSRARLDARAELTDLVNELIEDYGVEPDEEKVWFFLKGPEYQQKLGTFILHLGPKGVRDIVQRAVEHQVWALDDSEMAMEDTSRQQAWKQSRDRKEERQDEIEDKHLHEDVVDPKELEEWFSAYKYGSISSNEIPQNVKNVFIAFNWDIPAIQKHLEHHEEDEIDQERERQLRASTEEQANQFRRESEKELEECGGGGGIMTPPESLGPVTVPVENSTVTQPEEQEEKWEGAPGARDDFPGGAVPVLVLQMSEAHGYKDLMEAATKAGHKFYKKIPEPQKPVSLKDLFKED